MKQAIGGYFFFVGFFCLIVLMYFSINPVFFPFSTSPQVMSAQDNNTSKKIQGVVSKVIDGDTVVLANGQKVRYIGINSPEINQPYGNEATGFNKRLVIGKKVTVLFDAQEKDQYRRLLGYVYQGDRFINKEMIANGWAISESISPNVLHQQEFKDTEILAKKSCKGLWADICMPVTKSCINIDSIRSDASGVDGENLNDEWVVIENACTDSLDLTGWLLKDSSARNSYVFKTFELSPQQIVKIHSGCGIDIKEDLYWKCPEIDHAIWNNTGDEAMLFDTYGKLLSVYSY